MAVFSGGSGEYLFYTQPNEKWKVLCYALLHGMLRVTKKKSKKSTISLRQDAEEEEEVKSNTIPSK